MGRQTQNQEQQNPHRGHIEMEETGFNQENWSLDLR
jgi:hypothetical protein